MMLDGSFVPLFQSTPTPKRRVSIATKHLRLTKREYIDYKWDAIKHYFGKIKRKLSGWTLPNIASLIFILFMTKMFYEDNHQFVRNFFTDNKAKMAEPIMTSLNEMNFRMSMILEQQELIKKLNNDEMHILRKELEHSIESFKKDYLREMDNYTSKIETIQLELSNVSLFLQI
ncbi:unnamed protein product [Auanema sp. JU1783]|nr:unnamed protein product [Auanema sp. JU1783]